MSSEAKSGIQRLFGTAFSWLNRQKRYMFKAGPYLVAFSLPHDVNPESQQEKQDGNKIGTLCRFKSGGAGTDTFKYAEIAIEADGEAKTGGIDESSIVRNALLIALGKTGERHILKIDGDTLKVKKYEIGGYIGCAGRISYCDSDDERAKWLCLAVWTIDEHTAGRIEANDTQLFYQILDSVSLTPI